MLILELRFLANTVSIQASLQSAVRLISPNQAFAQHLLHHLEAAGRLVPSKSTMYRHRLSLTLAWYLHLQQEVASKKNICTYWMVDASPQGGVDLVQHICMVLSEDEVLRAWQISLDMYKNPKSGESQEQMKTLGHILEWQQGPCVGVGSGKAGLFYKLHALLHARRLISDSWDTVVATFHSSVAFTGDLGVESLFASVHPFPLASLIPWMSADSIDFTFMSEGTCETDFGHVSDTGALGLGVPDTATATPLEYHTGSGVFIAGMLHILHNIVGELVNVMEHFGTFRKDLTLLTTWLRRPHMRQRFQNTCLVGEFADLQAWFYHFSLRVDMHRWGVVVDGTCEVLHLEEALRKGFDPEAYGKEHQKSEDEDSTVKLSQLTEVIQSQFFWSYAKMVACCGRVLQEIAAWSEGCSCHSPADTTEVNRTIARKGGSGTCPMAGMRAPEMAAGPV